MLSYAAERKRVQMSLKRFVMYSLFFANLNDEFEPGNLWVQMAIFA